MLLHLTWNWCRAVQEDFRWYHWSKKTERFFDWMGTSIPQVPDTSKSCSIITRSVLAEGDATTLNKEVWNKNMKEYYVAVRLVFDVLMKEAILTKLYPAVNQTVYCPFWGMGAKITWDFGKSVSKKKKKNSDDTVKQITMPQFLQKVGKI